MNKEEYPYNDDVIDEKHPKFWGINILRDNPDLKEKLKNMDISNVGKISEELTNVLEEVLKENNIVDKIFINDVFLSCLTFSENKIILKSMISEKYKTLEEVENYIKEENNKYIKQ